MKVSVGDWVSFYRAGKIVLAEVRYTRARNSYSGDIELCTTEGACNEDGVLEIRHAAIPSPEKWARLDCPRCISGDCLGHAAATPSRERERPTP